MDFGAVVAGCGLQKKSKCSEETNVSELEAAAKDMEVPASVLQVIAAHLNSLKPSLLENLLEIEEGKFSISSSRMLMDLQILSTNSPGSHFPIGNSIIDRHLFDIL